MYYVKGQNGKRVGPFDVDKVISLYSDGKISLKTLLSTDGKTWLELGQLKGVLKKINVSRLDDSDAGHKNRSAGPVKNTAGIVSLFCGIFAWVLGFFLLVSGLALVIFNKDIATFIYAIYAFNFVHFLIWLISGFGVLFGFFGFFKRLASKLSSILGFILSFIAFVPETGYLGFLIVTFLDANN